jgi:hypothetical protein
MGEDNLGYSSNHIIQLFSGTIASAAKQSRNAANGKTGLPRLLRRLAMTMCVSPMINISDTTKEPDDE